ncbi:MAG TPA: hypothetical protein VN972_01065 [Methylomirabilota bacterium]|nr:hypothetical protein [Methylomirabilota bacterium]
MRLMHIAYGILLCAALSTSRPAASFGESGENASDESGRKTRVFLALFGGPQSYAMTDINHSIDQDNQVLAGSGFTAKKITGGTGFGAGIRVWPSSKLCLLFDYNRLPASASSSALVGTTPVVESVSAPASALMATVGYFRPWKKIHYGIAGGAGYYICNGNVDARFGSTIIKYDLHGKGFGAHALAMADIAASRGLHFELALGYRSAKSGNLESSGTTITLDDGSHIRADWSGLTTRFGFCIPFDHGPYPTHAGEN